MQGIWADSFLPSLHSTDKWSEKCLRKRSCKRSLVLINYIFIAVASHIVVKRKVSKIQRKKKQYYIPSTDLQFSVRAINCETRYIQAFYLSISLVINSMINIFARRKKESTSKTDGRGRKKNGTICYRCSKKQGNLMKWENLMTF